MELKSTLMILLSLAKNIWIWLHISMNTRQLVLASLLLQLILLFMAPLRKKTIRWIVFGFIWWTYQRADMTLTLAMTSLNDGSTVAWYEGEKMTGWYFLWAACLLLHFGGPDTITALSIDDNKLCKRAWLHFGKLLFSIASVALSMKSTMRHDLLVSSVLIFLAGFVKSVERVYCLSKANPRAFGRSHKGRKPDPGPDYAAIMEQYNFYKERGIPVKFVEEINKEPSKVAAIDGRLQVKGWYDAQRVQQAYRFYNKFKGTYADLAFCCHDRMEARGVFRRLPTPFLFTVVETEMKFAYEAFYTKAPLFENPWWVKARFLSLFLELAVLSFWVVSNPWCIVTTNLLAGAVFMEIIAFLRLYLSDWKIAHSAAATRSSPSRIALLFLSMRRRRWGGYPQETPLITRNLRFLFRQWSESILQLNFIEYCIHKRSEWLDKLYSFLGNYNYMMRGGRHVTSRWLIDNLRQFILEELQHKSSMAETLGSWEQVNSSRGGWILRYNASDDLDAATFEPYILDVEYDESLLMWHIATELFYETGETPSDPKEQEQRIFSKMLSEYMLYLLALKPSLMSRVAPMADIIFKDTCEEARLLFQRAMPEDNKEACERIMQVDTSTIPPGYIKAEEDNSVLFEASELAKRLLRVRRNPWKFVSQIWVELLCYAADNTLGYEHAVLLNEGGELVTLVRLLLLHFGLSNKFREARCIPTAELVVNSHTAI